MHSDANATATLSSASGRNNLRRLFWLRLIMIAGQCLAIAAGELWLDIDLPLAPLAAGVGALAAVNVFTALRMRSAAQVHDAELFAQLVVDVAGLTVQLYLTGGAANPFASLYLLPLSIAAAVLPGRYIWAAAAITIGAYSALLRYNLPLAGHALGHAPAFGLHVAGMWVTFVVSALLIATFVARMGQTLRERDRMLAAAREENLRNERIVALGTLAAGAAHELGTPLATMAVVAGEIQRAHARVRGLRDDLGIIQRQIALCKDIISQMLDSAGPGRAQGAACQPLDEFLGATVDKWRLMRPEAHVTFRQIGVLPAPRIAAESTLSQALINLFNNAADASPGAVELEASWNEAEVRLSIQDRGAGLAPEIAAQAGGAFFSTKPGRPRRGLGLFLTNATLERFGGTVQLFRREGGGTRTDVIVPLERIEAPAR